MHTHRYSFRDDETGLYWDLEQAGSFKPEPSYVYNSRQAKNVYGEYLAYNAARVKLQRPLFLTLVEEAVLYAPPSEIPASQAKFANRLVRGHFARFSRNVKGIAPLKSAMERERFDVLSTLIGVAVLKGRVDSTIVEDPTIKEMPKLERYYADLLLGVTSESHLTYILLHHHNTVFHDLRPFWVDLVATYPDIGVTFPS